MTNEMEAAEVDRAILLRHAHHTLNIPKQGYKITDYELDQAIKCLMIGSHVGRIGV